MMNIKSKVLSLMATVCILTACNTANDSQTVTINRDDAAQKVDVLVDGKLFTSYRYSPDMEKPFLYPINAANGSVVTRGYPLEPRKGERVDHPHHVGLWFNHGNVNGIDFWNNSSAIKDKTNFGHIVVTDIVKAKGGKRAVIESNSEWRDNDEKVLLKENTQYIITATADTRTIDHISHLTAVQDVTFTDNKEGMIAIRIDRAFETPTNEELVFTDEHGQPTKVEKADNTGVNGHYYSSAGYEGDDVWSTRNDWVLLTGEKDGTRITFGFFDHPQNIGYPFHSHARGYGLFSSNNFGSQVYNKNDDRIVVNIKAGDTVTLRHRFFIQSGAELPAEEANQIFKDFSKEYK